MFISICTYKGEWPSLKLHVDLEAIKTQDTVTEKKHLWQARAHQMDLTPEFIIRLIAGFVTGSWAAHAEKKQSETRNKFDQGQLRFLISFWNSSPCLMMLFFFASHLSAFRVTCFPSANQSLNILASPTLSFARLSSQVVFLLYVLLPLLGWRVF